MCGRFAQQRPASELAEIFNAEPLVDDPGPRYNVAPTDEALVVVQREDRRGVTAYRWGLIPHWADSAKVGSRMFNARAETLVDAPAFRDAFQRKRCVVPVECFYEWRREGALRQPYTIGRADGAPLVLAGLWDGWRDPATDTVRRSFTIVTSAPNETMATIHNRMPVMLPEEDWDAWLDREYPDRGRLLAMLEPRDGPELAIRAVSQLVNNVRNDGPELIAPI
jgi:putative SOS response-associated peptidase YedK